MSRQLKTNQYLSTLIVGEGGREKSVRSLFSIFLELIVCGGNTPTMRGGEEKTKGKHKRGAQNVMETWLRGWVRR